MKLVEKLAVMTTNSCGIASSRPLYPWLIANWRSPRPLSSISLFLCVYPSLAFSYYVDCCVCPLHPLNWSWCHLLFHGHCCCVPLLLSPAATIPSHPLNRGHHLWLLWYHTSHHWHCRRSHWKCQLRCGCWPFLSSLFPHLMQHSNCRHIVNLSPPPLCCLLSIVATVFPPLTCTVWLSIPPSCHPFSVTNLHLPSSPLDDQ